MLCVIRSRALIRCNFKLLLADSRASAALIASHAARASTQMPRGGSSTPPLEQTNHILRRLRNPAIYIYIYIYIYVLRRTHYNSNICSMLSTSPFSSALKVRLTTLRRLRAVKSARLAFPIVELAFASPSLSSHNIAAKPWRTRPMGSSGCAVNAASVTVTNSNGCLTRMLRRPHLCRLKYLITICRRLQSCMRGALTRRWRTCMYTARCALVNATHATAPRTDL